MDQDVVVNTSVHHLCWQTGVLVSHVTRTSRIRTSPLNRAFLAKLGISERTVKYGEGRLTQNLGTRSQSSPKHRVWDGPGRQSGLDLNSIHV